MVTHSLEFRKAQVQFEALLDVVRRAADEGQRIDEVEREVFGGLLRVGLALVEAYVAAQGDGDAGETLARGARSLRRLSEPHVRRYLSIFGELLIRRYVYGTREGQKIEEVPLDVALGLPKGEFSYVLEDWLQRLCVKESFTEAAAGIAALLGLKIGSRTAEHMNRELAQHVVSFRAEKAPPPAKEEAAIVVATADGKGVPMRRKREETPPAKPRRGKGEKANKKQMAYVGAVYTIAPFVRTAAQIVDELLRRECAADRPVPCHKEVWAEMARGLEGDESEPLPGRDWLFAQMAMTVMARNPKWRKTLVCLLDGEAALWASKHAWLARAIGILDIFHALERLWTVAHCIHAENSPQAAQFVTHHLTMLLEGKVGYVIGNFRRLIDQHDLHGAKRTRVRAAIQYYENNREHMHYDEYLAAGYPIGSGVAEGACRHLVKDRMEQTGMRWVLDGAQALLQTRSTYLNGDWDNFIIHRIEREQTALYGKCAA